MVELADQLIELIGNLALARHVQIEELAPGVGHKAHFGTIVDKALLVLGLVELLADPAQLATEEAVLALRVVANLVRRNLGSKGLRLGVFLVAGGVSGMAKSLSLGSMAAIAAFSTSSRRLI